MWSGWVWRAALGVTVLLASCVPNARREGRVAGNFSVRSGCDLSDVTVKPEAGGYQVSGCGKRTRYDCFSDGCQAAEEVSGPKTEQAPAGGRRRIELHLEVALERGSVLLFYVTPEDSEAAEVFLDTYPPQDCSLDLMLDGQRLELADGARAHSRVLPREVMLELTGARQMAVRACGRRWSLAPRDIQLVRRFASRYAEELAWQDAPRKAGSRQHTPPRGGWQPWHALAAFPPAAAADAVLSGTQLFEKLAPSVWRVESKLPSGVSQGSAVAVTKTSLVTNCHVIEGAQNIVVKQGKLEAVATLHHSEPAKDRCVLQVADTQLVPVIGVRPYVDLKVGEPLYTLGAPSGLELTLANGILSALREDEGVRYVQTTAPISPGSSGGGLFDARGNLVGITTLVFVGKEHLNQSLNFAIAAEMFWSP